jgi:short-subunit dehydrogenase
MASRKKSVALVTGGSSGIGLELAKVFAAEGHDVIIASDDRGKLEGAAKQLARTREGMGVTTIVVDLAKADGAKKLYQSVKRRGLNVDVLVNNAGVGVWGDFARNTDLAEELAMIQLNAASVVALTKLFVADMVKRRSGKILFTASEASLAPIANMSIYAATKAFVYSFAQSLREELKGTGVTVTALLPGATNTNFFARAGMMQSQFVKDGGFADPKDVARDGYDALMKEDDHVVTPVKDKIMSTIGKFMPDRIAVERVE